MEGGATQYEGAIRDQHIELFAEHSMLTGLLFQMKTSCGYPACSLIGLILRMSSLSGTTVDRLLDQAMNILYVEWTISASCYYGHAFFQYNKQLLR